MYIFIYTLMFLYLNGFGKVKKSDCSYCVYGSEILCMNSGIRNALIRKISISLYTHIYLYC